MLTQPTLQRRLKNATTHRLRQVREKPTHPTRYGLLAGTSKHASADTDLDRGLHGRLVGSRDAHQQRDVHLAQAVADERDGHEQLRVRFDGAARGLRAGPWETHRDPTAKQLAQG